MNQAAQAYRQVGAHGAVEAADPHRLIAMLLGAIVTQITTAKGHIARGEVGPRGESIGRAMEMIDTLRASLDGGAEGEIAGNLEALYDYMNRRLLEANVESSPAKLDEVSGLVNEIRLGWSAIEADVRDGG